MDESEDEAIEEFHEHDKIELRDISTEMKESFLDYSMSVIVSRALPDVRDGMKPVHRRILFAMNNLGLYSDKPTRKSAQIVGEVMGKLHPHGDSAIYSSLVRMAQDFSYRYPLITGQGNFGSLDGDGAAAMRYTEAKMSKITMEILRDINKNTVDFVDNYDASLKEPAVLPSRIPQLLLNGSMGIAVGMATNIPPHNLSETVNATIAVIEDPEISIQELMMEHIKGPDFPTGGYILGRSGIKNAYKTGRGSIIMRAKVRIEDIKNSSKQQIIVYEIPYGINKANMVERIAQLVRDKIIDGITDLRDESNRDGIRIVMELRRDVQAEVLLNQLYRSTQLQTNFGANMIALVNGQPKLLNIKEFLQYYIDHQIEVVVRKTQYELDRASERAHLLEGFVIALDNIDEVISIIRSSMSDDDVIEKLSSRFGLSIEQGKAILSMQLRRLTGLERKKIEEELAQLRLTIADLVDILANHSRVLEIIKTDLRDVVERYGDDRRTEILEGGFDVDDEDLIEKEDIVVTLTTNGYIKQTSIDEYHTQNRGGKGVKAMSVLENESIEHLLTMNTHDYILFFTNFGKVYRLKGYNIPSGSRTAKGIPVINLIDLDKDEHIMALLSSSVDSENKYALFVTKNGLFKRTPLTEMERINKNGKRVITLKDGDELVTALSSDGESDILIANSNGKAVRFREASVRASGRTAQGVKGITVDDGQVVGMTTSLHGNLVFSVTENGYGKLSDINDYRLTKRGGKGVITVKITEKNGELVAFKSVVGDEECMIVSDEGTIIRFSLESVARVGRNSIGVKLINVEDAKVSSLAIFNPEEEMTEE
ncbi:MAG: DNA gyrase subunit A [Erysipelothrix sp.]|nr:DNA gyrase subunit A [Erysipelothrix sp.]